MTIAITSGASCPDVLVDEVLLKIMSWFEDCRPIDQVLEPFTAQSP
jgi:4-hydroxy-3-methylbut-2-en-1-yl diphosphate reductase